MPKGFSQNSYVKSTSPLRLCPRENEVLQKLSQGLIQKQVAIDLNISEHSVKVAVSRARKRNKFKSTYELIYNLGINRQFEEILDLI